MSHFQSLDAYIRKITVKIRLKILYATARSSLSLATRHEGLCRSAFKVQFTHIELDCHCTFSDRGLRERPRGNRKKPNRFEAVHVAHRPSTGLRLYCAMTSEIIFEAIHSGMVSERSRSTPGCVS